MGENLGVWVRYNYATLRYSSLRGPWKIHEIPLLTGDTIQTASFMRQQRECDTIQPIWMLKVGIQEKVATGSWWQHWKRGQRVSGFSILAGFLCPQTKPWGSWASAGNSPAWSGKPDRTASQDPTNEHFSVSVSICSLSKHPQKSQAQMRESRLVGLYFDMVFP